MIKHIQLFALTAVLIAGCSLATLPESAEEQITLSASTSPQNTKTEIKDEVRVCWQADDQFSLFNVNSSHYQFTLVEGAGTETASFTGTVTSQKSPYYLIYPYNKANTKRASALVGGAYALNFPVAQTQPYVENSFAQGVNPMFATITNLEDQIEFKNIFGILRLDITGSCTITKIELRDLSGAMLWGDASIAISKAGTESQKTGFANGSDTVILDVNSSGGGLNLSGHANNFFHFVLPPGSLSKGFEAKVYNSATLLKTFTSTRQHTIARGHILRMRAVSMDKDPEPLIDETAIFSALPKGTCCTGIKSAEGGFSVCFSDGTEYKLSTERSALVTVGGDNEHELSDRCWYVNGEKQDGKLFISDSPYWTIGTNGNWFSDGTDSGTRAVPANKDAAQYSSYVTSILKMPTFIEVLLSDGSRFSFTRTDRTYEMYVQKSATEMDVYIDASKPGSTGVRKWIKYPLVKRYKSYTAGQYPSFYDNWGLKLVELCSKDGDTFTKQLDLFINGENESTLRTPDGKDGTFTACGGATHGFENIKSTAGVREITFEVDGTSYSEGSTISLRTASKIVVTMKSQMCCAYTCTDPYVDVTKVWTFENGKLSISITYDFIREITANVGKFGMVCCKRLVTAKDTGSGYITRLAVKGNRPAYVVNVEEGWSNYNLSHIDKSCTRITEYGDKELFFALVVDTPDDLPGSGMFVTTNGNNYNKIYYEAFGTESSRTSLHPGDRVCALVHWEIEEY